MMGADLLLDGFLGLFGSYRLYLELIKSWGLFSGYEGLALSVGHTINSLVLALFFVDSRIYNTLPTPWGVSKGLVFGAVWHLLVLVFLFITALGGAKFSKTLFFAPLKEHITLFVLHLIWGAVLGFLYLPPKVEDK